MVANEPERESSKISAQTHILLAATDLFTLVHRTAGGCCKSIPEVGRDGEFHDKEWKNGWMSFVVCCSKRRRRKLRWRQRKVWCRGEDRTFSCADNSLVSKGMVDIFGGPTVHFGTIWSQLPINIRACASVCVCFSWTSDFTTS